MLDLVNDGTTKLIARLFAERVTHRLRLKGSPNEFLNILVSEIFRLGEEHSELDVGEWDKFSGAQLGGEFAQSIGQHPEAPGVYQRTGCPVDAIYPLSMIPWL